MNKPLSHFTLSCFAVFCLALGLAALPQSGFAATAKIDGAYNGNAFGDSLNSAPPTDNELLITSNGDVTGWAGGAYGNGVVPPATA
jgi:hypothetical protein